MCAKDARTPLAPFEADVHLRAMNARFGVLGVLLLLLIASNGAAQEARDVVPVARIVATAGIAGRFAEARCTATERLAPHPSADFTVGLTAPSEASTILGPYQKTVAAMSRQTTKKTLASRQPPSHHPRALNAATKPPRRSQALRMFRAVTITERPAIDVSMKHSRAFLC